jgi:hypothetical protein
MYIPCTCELQIIDDKVHIEEFLSLNFNTKLIASRSSIYSTIDPVVSNCMSKTGIRTGLIIQHSVSN